jgi:hypothetical protein
MTHYQRRGVHNYDQNHKIPPYVKRRVISLYTYAIQNKVPSYIAISVALKYVLENEYPELLFKFDEPLPMKGYAKCIAIWSRAGLVRPINKREAIRRAISSPLFDQILIENGVPYEKISVVKERIDQFVNEYGGNLRQILRRIISRVISAVRVGEIV